MCTRMQVLFIDDCPTAKAQCDRLTEELGQPGLEDGSRREKELTTEPPTATGGAATEQGNARATPQLQRAGPSCPRSSRFEGAGNSTSRRAVGCSRAARDQVLWMPATPPILMGRKARWPWKGEFMRKSSSQVQSCPRSAHPRVRESTGKECHLRMARHRKSFPRALEVARLAC